VQRFNDYTERGPFPLRPVEESATRAFALLTSGGDKYARLLFAIARAFFGFFLDLIWRAFVDDQNTAHQKIKTRQTLPFYLLFSSNC